MAKSPLNILIVESPYYEEVSNFLSLGAIEALKENECEYERLEVPGALEISSAINIAAKSGRFDGFVALGCVLRGETSHYDIVCEQSAAGIMQLTIDQSLAIGNGILTCENQDQAVVRADPKQKNKGRDAVMAALALINIKNKYM